MKFFKEYAFPVAAFLLIWAARQFWGETGQQAAIIVFFVSVAAVSVITLCHSRKKYRYCPKCGCGTELSWHTEKIDARRKWVRVGSKWHYGGFVTQKTAIIRCPGCGWEINLGK